MDTKLLITLAVLAYMVVAFLLHKHSYGLTAMTCLAALVLGGVIDIGTAFAGFSSTTTILIVTMMVLSGALNKTSMVAKIREKMSVIQGKNGVVLLALIFIFTAALTQMMGMTAVMSIMLLIITTLDDGQELSHSRMIFLCAAVNAAWFGRIPIGMGTALPMQTNAMYQGLVEGHDEYLLGLFDLLKIGIIPTICLTIYCLFAWKLIPKHEIDAGAFSAGPVREQEKISPFHEKMILGVFFAVLIAFFFSNKLGNLMYVIPVIGCLILLYTKAITARDVGAVMGNDMVFMCAGVLGISSAMSSSGAGNFIGNSILSLLGGNPSSLKVIAVFAIATTVMTTFLSNYGTMAVMIPIACSTALAGGMNPKAVVLVVNCASCLAIAFPTGCAAATIAYAVGNHNPVKMLKFTLPYIAIGLVSLIVSASIFFPVY